MARITLFFFLHLNQYPSCTYEIYTYGEPRVGNKAFVDFMNNQALTAARVVARYKQKGKFGSTFQFYFTQGRHYSSCVSGHHSEHHNSC